MYRNITTNMIKQYELHLQEMEKSSNTIKKYLRDLKNFRTFSGENCQINKELVIRYKGYLKNHYQINSANSMIAALNYFFRWANWTECTIKTFKVQKECFRSTDKELSLSEYKNLLATAQQKGQKWLYLIILTLCSTGIRISELPYITVHSLSTHQAEVYNKGKIRKVILPRNLCIKLCSYAKEKGILEGSIFVTKNNKPIDRCNIYHAMKKLSHEADAESSKVYPHNLRHLFAVQYYKQNHDLSGLASILGHSNINTTRIYTMVSIKEKESNINLLGLVV